MLPLAGGAVLAGAALQLQQRELWFAGWVWVEVLTALAVWGLALLRVVRRAVRSDVDGSSAPRPGQSIRGVASTRHGMATVSLAVLAGGLLLGHAQAEWRAAARLADRLTTSLEGVDLVVTGVVAALPTQRSDGIRLRLEVESATRADTGSVVRLPDLLSLGWYHERRTRDVEAVADPAPGPADLRAGERWRLPVRLYAPRGLSNPGGFDYELWLFEHGVGATGYVRSGRADQTRRLDVGVAYPVQQLRQWLRDRIHARLGDSRAAGVVAALCVGDQAGISREDWELFRTTGVAHLVAISGVHLTMLAWLAAAIVRRSWPWSPSLALALPAPHAARIAGVAVALAYAMLAGWGVPAQRTVFMIAVAGLTPLIGLRWPWPVTLVAAALVVTLLDPWALLQPGFWLSFVAVGLLMLQSKETEDTLAPQPFGLRVAAAGDDQGATGAHSAPLPSPAAAARALGAALWRSIRSALHTQAVATLGLAPLSLLFFHQLALVGFVANVVAIPLVTLLITPLVLLGCLVSPLWSLAAWLVELQSSWLALLAGVPMASWQPPTAQVWAQALALLGALVILLPGPRSLRLTGLPLLLPVLWAPTLTPAAGHFELLGADVGQGQAVLVRTRHHSLLYDAGAQYSRDSDAGERVLVPLLRGLGIAPLDLLMLSHRDTDHVGGARAVFAGVGARDFSSSLETDHPLLAGRTHRRCLAGQRWSWDGVSFEVLHPTERDYERHAAGHLRPNALSCVLRIDDGRRSALLLGDVERLQELELLERSASRLRADVLLVAHHGSHTSSDPIFLDHVTARWGLIQAGHHNRYGHPADEVVERLLDHGITLVRTDVCGAWHWRSADAQNWCHRVREHRYWHAPLRGDGLELAIHPYNNSP
ncbi:MAG: DNA internalization-related competence protein ComEC/Rec2 [Burkholderiales bacterium]|nr:DNA internalization-related competence protein ComEC/Rec2 [Burkholderiales bacterium]